MGAFLLCKRDLAHRQIENGTMIFQKKGFDTPGTFTVGDYYLFSYKKQLLSENNIRTDGHTLLAGIGTPVYKMKSYRDTLDLLYDELKRGVFDSSQMYGSYILIFYDGSIIRFLFDDMCQMPVYSSTNGSVISSSFLACAKAYGKGLTLNKMACLEKLCSGMIIGTDTIFNEISRDIPKNLTGIKKTRIDFADLIPNRKGKSLPDEARKQLVCLRQNVKAINALVSEYGADMGISGGYDSRLIYGLLQNQFGDALSVHTHCTKGSHEQEKQIANQLGDMYHKKVNLVPTIPLQDMDQQEADETLATNMYLFDGYSDSHYGTFSSTYSKEYRESVSNGKRVFFTGISGEIYRNYRKISKPVFTKNYFDTYVFFCHYKEAIQDSAAIDYLRQYVMSKSFAEMGNPYSGIMTPRAVRRYNAVVRLPYKASCASAAFNQLCFYDAPCSHRDVIRESMAADRVVGDDSRLEVEMIRLIDPVFWNVPVTKADSTSIGHIGITTSIERFVYARLPMCFIKRRKLKNNDTSIGVCIVHNSDLLQEAITYVKELIGKDISIDCLIKNKNSYQNTVFLCRMIYEFKGQIQ